MAEAVHQKLVALRVEFLEKQRNHLQMLVDDADKVLNLSRFWLKNDVDNVSYKDISQMIEDKIAQLGDKCMDFPELSEACVEVPESEFASTSSAVSSVIDQPVSSRYYGASGNSVEAEILKTIMTKIEVMQETISSLTASAEKMTEEQANIEEQVGNLSDNCFKTEGQIRELAAQLEKISVKQDEATALQNERIYGTESRIESVMETQTQIKESCHLQQEKIKEQKQVIEKLEKQSKQLEENLSITLENNLEFVTRIDFLEANCISDTQLRVVEQKVEVLETASAELSEKIKECGSSLTDLTERTDDVVTQLHGSELEKLKKFEEKFSVTEARLSEVSREIKNQYTDVESKYKMVCRIIADQLAPLEKLKNIFNNKLKARKEYSDKLDSVCKAVDDLQMKFGSREMSIYKPPVGFSAVVSLEHQLFQGRIISSFTKVIVDTGNHFDPKKGIFTAPVNGVYATSLCGLLSGNATFFIVKHHQPNKSLFAPVDDIVGRLYIYRDRCTVSISALVYLEAGDIFFVRCRYVEYHVQKSDWLTFSCFKIE